MQQVSFRQLEYCDANTIREWMGDTELRRMIGTRGEITEEGHRAWFEKKMADTGNVTYVILCDGTEAGLIGTNVYSAEDRTAEMYLYIGNRAFRGMGVGRKAISAFTEKMFSEKHLYKLTAKIFSFNKPSIKAFTACGFVQEGIQRKQVVSQGTRVDLVWMGLVNPAEAEPGAIL